jgi:hypothetical protein
MSGGGTIFFGDPSDVQRRAVIAFDFKPDGVRVRAFPTTDTEVVREFKLTPRRVAVARVAFRLVMRDPLDMPPPPSVPDPRDMRTCNRVVASVDHGCLLLHLVHCARVRRGYCYSAARGLAQLELYQGLVPVQGMHALLSRTIRHELASEIGLGRAAQLGLIKDGEDMS